MNQHQDGVSDQALAYVLVFVIITAVGVLLYLTRKYIRNTVMENESGIQLGDEPGTSLSIFQSFKELNRGFYSGAGKNKVRVQFHKIETYLQKKRKGTNVFGKS
jgi:hypothetical protein